MPVRFLVRACTLALAAALLPAAAGAQEAQPRGIDSFCPPGDIPPSGFTDTAGNPHHAAIECLAAYGIAAGTTDTTYSPRMAVRRDQMASFIARLIDHFGDFLPEDPDHAFDDVAPGNPHALRINQLAAVTVVGGFADGTYRPGATVTRDGMASFINRAIGLIAGEPLTGPPGAFTDTAGNPHEDNIDALAAEGIVAGFGDGTYRPREPVFRDQMASFLARSGDLLAADTFTSTFFAVLVGEAEVDDSLPGQPRFGQGEEGTMAVIFTNLNSNTGLLCIDLGLGPDTTGPFTGFHIHEGRMYENGDVVVDLGEPTEGGVCLDEDPETLAAIEEDPSGYYYNLHTEDFPAGALRGQVTFSAIMLTHMSWAFAVDDAGDDYEFGQGEEDADGFGLAMIDLIHGEMCVYGRTTASPPFVGFHIHEGAMNENGDIVVELNTPDPASSESSTCPEVDDDLLQALFSDRERYYLNIHNAQFPNGAVRGQLDAATLVLPLSGEEVPTGGEPDATGTFYGQLTFTTGLACAWTVTDATGPFTGMHIHEGARGEEGPIRFPLDAPDDDTGEVSQCLDVSEDDFEILFDVENHYLNIHTEDYPAGAVRGQLVDGLVS